MLLATRAPQTTDVTWQPGWVDRQIPQKYFLGIIEKFPSRVNITEALNIHKFDGITLDFTLHKEISQGSHGNTSIFGYPVSLGLIIF